VCGWRVCTGSNNKRRRRPGGGGGELYVSTFQTLLANKILPSRYLFPKSRFYGSPVLTVSGLRGTVSCAWKPCGGDEYRLKHHEPRLELFKSEGVAIEMTIERPKTEGVCALIVYTETLLWLSRVYRDLFCVSRPRIKRGPLWQNVKSPKLNTLGQHMLTTAITLELLETAFIYYDDLDRKYVQPARSLRVCGGCEL
jgi:hypothetical protein